MKYKIAVFYVLKYGWTQKRHYHIITWETSRPWNTYETVLYYLPRKRLSHHRILRLPGAYHSYAVTTPNFKIILETRTNVKKATKIVEYERTT
jgi:hypothetical protein